MRYEDLPATVRAKVDIQIGRRPAVSGKSRRVATEGTTSRWRCPKCGTIYTSEASADRAPCRRLEVIFA